MSYARTTISASAKQSVVVPAVKTRTSTLPAIVNRVAVPRTIRNRTLETNEKEVSHKAVDMIVVTPNEIRTTSVPQHRTRVPGKSLLRVREQAYAQTDDMRVRWLNLSTERKLALFTEMNAQYGEEAITALGSINEQRKCMGLAVVPTPVEPENRTPKARFANEDKLFKFHRIVSRLVGPYKVTDADLTQSEIDQRIAAAKLKAEEDAMVIEAAKIEADRRIALAERMAYWDARSAEQAKLRASAPIFTFTPASPIKAANLTSSGAPGLLLLPVMNRFGRLDRDDDFEDEDFEEED